MLRRNDLAADRHPAPEEKLDAPAGDAPRGEDSTGNEGVKIADDRAGDDPRGSGLTHTRPLPPKATGIRGSWGTCPAGASRSPPPGARNGGSDDAGVVEIRLPLNRMRSLPVPHCNVYQHVSLHPT